MTTSTEEKAMTTTPKERRLQKRFAAFLICAGLLFASLFFSPVSEFDMFAKMLVGLYTLYLGGQTATDWKNAASAATGVDSSV
jgi:hypothetical protein